MRIIFGIVFSLLAADALAHGDVGNRTFPETLQFEDPSPGDELTLPEISRFKGSDGAAPSRYVTEYEGEFERRLTEDFSLSVGGAFEDEDRISGNNGEAGFDDFAVGAKYQLYDSDAHEFVLSLGGEIEIGDSGSNGVGPDYSVITPSMFFGKGMNELPYALKPLAFTGGLGVELPTDDHSSTAESDEHNPALLETSFAIQYSLPYLQQQGTALPPFFAGLTPIVEFHYETPFGSERTVGTISPGVIWSNDDYQIGLEAVLPGAAHSGQGVGFTAQLHFYLDDLLPHHFGTPVFGG